ncbi:MAG: tellurite resistance protein [Polyangiales bacterium]|jgi:tellurite resistance protein
MKLNELNADEQTLFLGLLREIVTADGEYSDEEREAVSAIETEMGSASFVAAMTRAKDEYHSRTDIVEAAKFITRLEAKKLVMDRLIHIASSDGVDDAEEKPLRWLAKAWPDAVLK